jgi:hypothetical protein
VHICFSNTDDKTSDLQSWMYMDSINMEAFNMQNTDCARHTGTPARLWL